MHHWDTGPWLVKASDRQGEHDKLFGYEELSGDDFLFDGNHSFDLLAVDHKCGVKALTEPCTSVNPIQDASPSIKVESLGVFCHNIFNHYFYTCLNKN
jgi:hypothetical protein